MHWMTFRSLEDLNQTLIRVWRGANHLKSIPMGKDGKDWQGEGVASELFIAQVVRVERTLPEGEAARPLLYHRRGYVTTQPIDPGEGTKTS